MQIQIRGLQETIKNLDQIGNRLNRMEGAMRQVSALVSSSAKQNAPVDTGVLRASITASVKGGEFGIEGVTVGSNISYAPHMEYGTRPHWPPVAALEGWARRHGMSAFLVARAIARRGTKPRYFLRRALSENRSQIIRIFNEAVARIIR